MGSRVPVQLIQLSWRTQLAVELNDTRALQLKLLDSRSSAIGENRAATKRHRRGSNPDLSIEFGAADHYAKVFADLHSGGARADQC